MSIVRLGKILAMWAVLAAAFLVVSASAESKARIVRLSEVQGSVQIDRTAGEGFDKAFINLPLIEGSKLRTGKDGRAEVEFEDGSALRLAPNTEVNFLHLALGDDGQKLSAVQLVSGTVYANLHPKKAAEKGDQFLLNFARESVTVSEAAHFRVELNDASATLAVFKGKLSAASPSAQIELAEKHSATINFASNDLANDNSAQKDTFVIARNYEPDPNDAWDHQQTDYHDRYASNSNAGSSINSPYGYGMSDLNYYGNFMTVPGYGNVWQPYFIGANWSPFQDGGWAFYPSFGYMFVSGYPWGWMPYNYGNWAFVPGFGWVWQPGYWNSFNLAPRVVNAPVRTKLPTPPVRGHQTVMVGLGLAANPALGAPHRMTINPGSAGFGVQRGSVRHLDHVAKTMERTSRPVVVSTAPPVSTAAPTTGFGTNSGPSPTRGGTSSGMTPMAAPHRATAPPRPH